MAMFTTTTFKDQGQNRLALFNSIRFHTANKKGLNFASCLSHLYIM